MGNVQLEISIVGLENSGKSQIIYLLQQNEYIPNMIPTVGFNMHQIKFDNYKIKLWDLGGQKKFRGMWERYCRGNDAIIFTIDSCDASKFDAVRRELNSLFQLDFLKHIPVLLLFTKWDTKDAMKANDILKKLNYSTLKETVFKNRTVTFLQISGKTYDDFDLIKHWMTTIDRNGSNALSESWEPRIDDNGEPYYVDTDTGEWYRIKGKQHKRINTNEKLSIVTENSKRQFDDKNTDSKSNNNDNINQNDVYSVNQNKVQSILNTIMKMESYKLKIETHPNKIQPHLFEFISEFVLKCINAKYSQYNINITNEAKENDEEKIELNTIKNEHDDELTVECQVNDKDHRQQVYESSHKNDDIINCIGLLRILFYDPMNNPL
eukprot:241522_1